MNQEYIKFKIKGKINNRVTITRNHFVLYLGLKCCTHKIVTGNHFEENNFENFEVKKTITKNLKKMSLNHI